MRHILSKTFAVRHSGTVARCALIPARRGSVAKKLLFTLLLLGMSSAANAEGTTYTYDSLGRVTSVSYSSGMIIVYSYDLNGNRTSTVTNTNTTFGVWNSFNWSAALWHSTTPSGVWGGFNWNAATWSP